MSEEDSRFEALENRVRALEDVIALYQTLSAYGPAIDSKEFDAAASLWETDGLYDLGGGFPELDGGRGVHYLEGREAIKGMFNHESTKRFFEQGCAHIMSLPLIKVEGDRAVAIGYHTNYMNDESGARLARLTASRVEWRRQEDGTWKVTNRKHRLIHGDDESRELLRSSFYEITGGSDEGK